ncbi:hypothetical protein NADFUDRAFT_45248 [Nadsonia fulvescens var. elongata DSM 6958]|uniref:Uncharacterized protein n=1 Tax=Nadsonia fulvescens var. elongata DSM 6958 TaxID=857566 RepID=A0A1E3PNK3_9ASCO|nr:hypothetical protein NADFUDRAFT_45248 [Nadsonia fulvescens var. elongata DSM 6958]
MDHCRVHPILSQVPLVISPFVSIPVAVTLPFNYVSLTGTKITKPTKGDKQKELTPREADIRVLVDNIDVSLKNLSEARKKTLSQFRAWDQAVVVARKKVAPGYWDTDSHLLMPERLKDKAMLEAEARADAEKNSCIIKEKEQEQSLRKLDPVEELRGVFDNVDFTQHIRSNTSEDIGASSVVEVIGHTNNTRSDSNSSSTANYSAYLDPASVGGSDGVSSFYSETDMGNNDHPESNNQYSEITHGDDIQSNNCKSNNSYNIPIVVDCEPRETDYSPSISSLNNSSVEPHCEENNSNKVVPKLESSTGVDTESGLDSTSLVPPVSHSNTNISLSSESAFGSHTIDETSSLSYSTHEIPSSDSSKLVFDIFPGETGDEIATDEIATEKLAFSEIIPERITTDELTSNEFTSNEFTSNELTSNELTSNEIASEGISSGEAICNSSDADVAASEESTSKITFDEPTLNHNVSDKTDSNEKHPPCSSDIVSSNRLDSDNVSDLGTSDDVVAEETNPDNIVSHRTSTNEIASDENISDLDSPGAFVAEELPSDNVTSLEISTGEMASDLHVTDKITSSLYTTENPTLGGMDINDDNVNNLIKDVSNNATNVNEANLYLDLPSDSDHEKDRNEAVDNYKPRVQNNDEVIMAEDGFDSDHNECGLPNDNAKRVRDEDSTHSDDIYDENLAVE